MTSKKQSFLHGAMYLTIATVLVKVIGALYKIPLNAVIGAQGYAYFSTAYQIYSVLLLISTAGLPVAMSRMVSQAAAAGRFNQVRRVYSASRALFLGLGTVSSLLMVVFCKQLANFEHQPNAWAAIACLGPCAFFVCLLSTYRGYFQGQSNMRPSAVSEVMEAVFKLVIGIPAAMALLSLTDSRAYAAAGAILGVTTGSVVSSIYMGVMVHKDYRTLPVTDEEPERYGSVIKKLLATAIPITVGSAGLQALYLVETNLFMGQLLTFGTQDQADTWKGVLDMALTIYNLPCSLIAPITVSLIPAVTAHLTQCNDRGVRETEESSARVTALIAMPCAVGLMVLAEPVTALISRYTGEELVLGARCLRVLGLGVYFYSLTQLTNAILQSHGRASLPMLHIIASGVAKLAIVYLLSGNESLGVVGVAIGSMLCNVSVTVLNMLAIRRHVPQKPAMVRNFLRPALPSAIMGVAVYAVWRLLKLLPGALGSSTVILCAVPVLAGVAVYAFAAVKCKAITREDCLLLPKGEKIAKLLHL